MQNLNGFEKEWARGVYFTLLIYIKINVKKQKVS